MRPSIYLSLLVAVAGLHALRPACLGAPATLTKLGTLPSSGEADHGGLTIGSDGSVYGTTYQGGTNGGGMIYRVAPDGTFSTAYNFDATTSANSEPMDGVTPGNDGALYGTTSNALFNPFPFVPNSNGGTFFRFTPADGKLTTLYTFPPAGINGVTYPSSRLVKGTDGNFYGMTGFGFSASNANGCAFYRLTPAGQFTLLHEFAAPSGDSLSPLASGGGLGLDGDGNFYVTLTTGSTQAQTLYRLAPAGTVLGALPSTYPATRFYGFVAGNDGNFYGTAQFSENAIDPGAVIKMTPDGTASILDNFQDENENNAADYNYPVQAPRAPLLLGQDGNFYGTTVVVSTTESGSVGTGGGTGTSTTVYGTIFQVTPSGVITLLYGFSSSDGGMAVLDNSAPLLQGPDGSLYGVMNGDGNGGQGPNVLYRLTFTPPPVVTLAATASSGTAGGAPAVLTFSSPAPVGTATVVRYLLGGTGAYPFDYTLSTPTFGVIKLKAGKTQKQLELFPTGNIAPDTKKTAILTLQPGPGYTVGTTGKIKVKLHGP